MSSYVYHGGWRPGFSFPIICQGCGKIAFRDIYLNVDCSDHQTLNLCRKCYNREMSKQEIDDMNSAIQTLRDNYRFIKGKVDKLEENVGRIYKRINAKE